MKPFMDKDFLLQTEVAKKLYHEYAAQVPVLDYHCHLNPQEIAEDIHFKNMTELWLGADHYKSAFMRHYLRRIGKKFTIPAMPDWQSRICPRKN